MTYIQPDGTEVQIRLIGDEYHHYYLSEDGYPVAKEGGYFYYADLDADGTLHRSDFRLKTTDSIAAAGTASSGSAVDAGTIAESNSEVKATRGLTPGNSALDVYLSSIDREVIPEKMEVARQRARAQRMATRPLTRESQQTPGGPGLFPDSTYPTKGEQRALVILVEFADVSMTLDNPHDYFSRMLNEEGFSDWGGTGSAYDYFLECSDGQFAPRFDLYGPITLPRRMVYYGGNDASGNDRRPAQMVADACELLDDEIDFSLYDCDGDGIIDNVFIFYAGEGEAAGGNEDTIWPHSWYVTSGMDAPQIFDGVTLDRYACSCEWVVENRQGRPDGVGTFIHEFSHVLGLPDLYSTTYSNCFTPGNWSALDNGAYNNHGCTPPLYSAFERYALGWLTPFDMSKESKRITLKSIGENVAGIIPTKIPNEYFLVENRQQVSWDKYIPGHGILIWHIDYNKDVWWNNEVNVKPRHQHVDLVEADGSILMTKDRRSDSFPGLKNITAFTDDTTPSAKSWAGIASGVAITDIAEADGLVTFVLNGGASAPMLELGSISWHIEGSGIIVEGLQSGVSVRVYDLTGRIASQGVVDDAGTVSLTLPHPGVYILSTPTGSQKITRFH